MNVKQELLIYTYIEIYNTVILQSYHGLCGKLRKWPEINNYEHKWLLPVCDWPLNFQSILLDEQITVIGNEMGV